MSIPTPTLSNQEELLKMLDIVMDDLTPDQKDKLEKISKTINPSTLTPNRAVQIVEDLGLDLEAVQKAVRRRRAEERQKNKPPKVGANEKCPCNSGKKYKHCCRYRVLEASSRNPSSRDQPQSQLESSSYIPQV